MRVQHQNNRIRNIKRAAMLLGLLAIAPLFLYLLDRAVGRTVCRDVINPQQYHDLYCQETGISLAEATR